MLFRVLFLVFSSLLLTSETLAEVTRIEISSQAPFAGGKSFGATGPYLRVIGRFHGELDPTHPANRHIVDIRNAPRNVRGRVEYSADFDILRPADPYKGNGTLFYDVNNRGNKRLVHLLNDVPADNALDTPESAGDGFLMRHGFNETEDLRTVFEGINPHVASARLFLMQTVTSTEYWQGGHSLNTTDPMGDQDIALPENVRVYHFAGTQHVITPTMPRGVCAAPPNVAVPAATTTGWSLRSAEGGSAGELCGNDGAALPFARTAAEREAAKDPRPSLAERYQDKTSYISRVRSAAQELQRRGFYLGEDIDKTVDRVARNW